MPEETASHSPLRRALDWWHGARDLWSHVEDLERMTPEEVERLAADIGVTSAELRTIVTTPGGSVDLLYRRLAALELDAEEIRKLSPLLLADLERTCAACPDRERCASEMAADPLPPGWESYCPNSGTLKTLT
jgi:hypothetical protein